MTKLFNLTPATQMRVYSALEGILEIGKRNLQNEKYDDYFIEARAALNQAKKEMLPQLFPAKQPSAQDRAVKRLQQRDAI